MKPGYETAKLLITVKTYPAPSARHVETVCVAGIRLDRAAPEWVRLYPIPFRKLGDQEQFKKYQLVDAEIAPRLSSDPRPESYSPDLESIRLGATINTSGNWKKRKQIVEPLLGQTTTCELIAKNRATAMNMPAPSLALIKPEVLDVKVTTGKPWNAKQLAKAKRAALPDLFDTPLFELQPMPYNVKYRYRCAEPGCPKHLQSVIDWELGAAGFYWPKLYGNATAEKIEEKWTQIVDPKRDVHFFIGNQHQYRTAFSVIGVWSPAG